MSRVRVRVAAEVAFFTTFCVVEVRLVLFLPVTLLLTAVPRAVAAYPELPDYPEYPERLPQPP